LLVDLGQSTNVPQNREAAVRVETKWEPESDKNREVVVRVETKWEPESDNRLGTLYQEKLKLTEEEVGWLNKFWNPQNAFTEIEGCCIAVIRLYLAVIQNLNERLNAENQNFTQVIDYLCARELGFSSAFPKLSLWEKLCLWENSYTRERIEMDLFYTIYKRAENAVRFAYEHKRKISTEFTYSSTVLSLEFERLLGEKVNLIIEELKNTIPAPEEETEIELNARNRWRWKIKYGLLEQNFRANEKEDYINGVFELEKKNIKNPNIENIFFEAHKFIGTHDRVQSLKFYIYYLHYDLKSACIDNKAITKTLKKSLFENLEQQDKFEKIVKKFLKTRDLDWALAEVNALFEPARKSIKLNKTAIKKSEKQDKETVQLLNKYLEDQPEISASVSPQSVSKEKELKRKKIKLDAEIIQKAQRRDKEAVHLLNEILQDDAEMTASFEVGQDRGEEEIGFIIERTADKTVLQPDNGIFKSSLSLSPIQTELLILFRDNDLQLSEARISEFCKAQGVFKGQLIDSLNENCYDLLDDNLVEEIGENYCINPKYYNQIKR
jgi:hypothetical protein